MDETTNPEAEVEVEVETVEDIEQEEQAEPELDEDGNPIEGPDEPDEDSAAETEEIEYDGKKYSVPKELKDGFLRQADYTRKTQELAAKGREVEAALERLQTTSQEETRAFANVAALAAQVAQYEQIDWDAYDQQDPVSAQREWRNYTLLKEQQNAAIGEYQKAQHNARSAAQLEHAKRVEEGQKQLAAKIPGWGQDKAVAILDFASSTYGFTREELAAVDDPRAIIILHDLMEARRVQKQAATAKKVEKQVAVKPAATVKGGGTVVKGLDDRLSTDEWFKRRNEQLRKRG